MIASLSVWLKQIIVMILIATFVELILPGKSMERYVKVVVSLFILLTILTPIIQFLRSDFELDLGMLESSATQQVDRSIASVQRILTSGDDIRVQQEEQALGVLEERVSQLMREEVEAQFSVSVSQVDVKAGMNRKKEPELQRVTIKLASIGRNQETEQSKGSQESENEEAEGGVEVRAMDPIEPIDIDIRLDHPPGGSMPAMKWSEAEMAADEKKLSLEMSSWLANRWGIPLSSVQIIFAE